MPKAQFLDLPWNLASSAFVGQETAQGVPVHALADIEVRSYPDAKHGKSNDITLHFNNGALSITSKGNAAQVLKFIDDHKTGGLTNAFVHVKEHAYIDSSTGGIGCGWAPLAYPKVISVPDFLQQTV